jgi:hypothetical protein
LTTSGIPGSALIGAHLSGDLGQVLLRVERLPVVELAEHEGQLGRDLQVVDTGHGAASAGLLETKRLDLETALRTLQNYKITKLQKERYKKNITKKNITKKNITKRTLQKRTLQKEHYKITKIILIYRTILEPYYWFCCRGHFDNLLNFVSFRCFRFALR